MSRRPRLLDANLQEVTRLNPVSMSVDCPLDAAWTATMELAEDDTRLVMHNWVEVYTPRGSAGIFRVTNIEDTKRGTRTVTLMHAIDTLSDSVWSGQTDYDGTVAGYMAAVLAQQPVARWQLGTCADANDWKKSGINYDRLSELLDEVRKEEYGYYLTYSFATTPWTLNFAAQGSAVTSEFRLDRNVENCVITRSDEEMCNRLYLSVNQKNDDNGVTTTETQIKTYNNTSSQASYGIIEKTADIDLEDVVDADAWAADFLAKRATPEVLIVIDGWALQAITGETWDEARLGEVARVALPDSNEVLEERVVSVSYPELIFGDGADKPMERVTVQLANHTESFSETISQLKKDQKKTARAGRGAARGGASAGELENWAIVTQHHGEVLDDSGVTELYESGIEVDAQSGVRIYSLAQGFQSQHSEIKVERDRISLVVEGTGANASVKAASIVAAINDTGSTVTISADKIELQGSTTIDKLLSGRATLSKINAQAADFMDVRLMQYGTLELNDPTVKWNQYYVTWQSMQVVESVAITEPSITLSGQDRFLVATSSTDMTPGGYSNGRIVTAYTPGNHTVTPVTLYYLGRPY